MLLLSVLALVVMHVVCRLAPSEMEPETVRIALDNFHFDGEGTVPAWFSSSLLLLAGLGMIVIGVLTRRAGERFGPHWLAMGVIFLLLSMDEAAAFHELLIRPLRNRLDLDIGFLHFAWVLPAMAGLAVLAVVYLPFVLALPARTGWGLVAAAVVYVSGAVGMEMVGATFVADERANTVGYFVGMTVEETLEKLGLVVLLHVLLTHALVVAPHLAPQFPARRRVPSHERHERRDHTPVRPLAETSS